MKTPFLIMATLLLQTSLAHAFTEKDLQKKLRGVRAAYGWSCTGSACNAVFTEQLVAMDELNFYVDGDIPNGQVLSALSGRLARTAASAICGYSIAKGKPDLVHEVVRMENRTMLRLERLQRMAGIAKPRKCRRIVQ